MPQSGTIYRVLMASPADCVHERKLVPEIIAAWNAAHSFRQAAILEPVLWETHARPELGDRPQAIINKQLVDNCDILIGTFWARLGTSTGKAESGTAEEIEEFRAKGKQVFLYFSSAPVVPDSLDMAQYQALMEYKKKLGEQGLFFRYDSLSQLRELLHGHLASFMSENHAGPPGSDHEAEAESDPVQEFKSDFASFLRRFESEWASERDSDPHNLDDGKIILASALDQVLNFRSMIVKGLEDVAIILNDTAREMRVTQRHQLYMDGGKSFREFFSKGDAILAKLKTIPGLIPTA